MTGETFSTLPLRWGELFLCSDDSSPGLITEIDQKANKKRADMESALFGDYATMLAPTPTVRQWRSGAVTPTSLPPPPRRWPRC